MREWQEFTKRNTYVINAESAAETARLLDQHALLTQAMGGLFPADLDLFQARNVLDVACGPGGWVQDVAGCYPELTVVGIDSERDCIHYACAQAKVQGLYNAHFRVMDVTHPLAFPDATFDVVNARFLNSFLLKTAWQPVLRELVRVTRPGGSLRLIECDRLGRTNSPAFAEMERLLLQAASLDPRKRYVDAMPMLGRWLREQGLLCVQEVAHLLNFSARMPSHVSHCHNLRSALQLLQPFILSQGVASQEQLAELYERVLSEILSDDFCGVWSLIEVYGQKP